jgi:hypothetical protein
MQLTLLKGYPDFVGKRAIWCGYGNGPSSLAAAGDPIALPLYEWYIDGMAGDFISVSTTYGVVGVPSAVGARASWVLVWRFATAASVASVTIGSAGAGTGMTPGTYLITPTGGGGSGAQVSVVVSSATLVSSATVVLPGKGYTSVPTVPTTALGGSPPSLTAVLSTIAAPVAAGANLSAEQVQIMGFGGQF